MTVTPELSAKMRNMSFVCALMVVAIHCNVSTNPSHDAFWLGQLTSYTLCRAAVPFFFAASGFFLQFKFSQEGWWRREVGKRVSTLLLPFLAVSAAYLLWTVPIDALKDLRHGDVLRHNPLFDGRLLSIFGLDLTEPPLCVPLWYVRNLFLLAVLSPALLWLLEKSRGAAIVLSFAACYAVSPILAGETALADVGLAYRFFRYGFSLEGATYFMVGMWLGRHGPVRVSRTAALLCAAAGLAMSVYRAELVRRGCSPHVHWAVLAVPPYLIAMFRFMPTRPLPGILASNTFAIYMLHMFPCFLFTRCVSKVAKHWHTMVLELLFVIAASLCLAELIRRKSPRLARVVFGGR
jgi:surface polysaccharide O-acyltransferase-like enzyme